MESTLQDKVRRRFVLRVVGLCRDSCRRRASGDLVQGIQPRTMGFRQHGGTPSLHRGSSTYGGSCTYIAYRMPNTSLPMWVFSFVLNVDVKLSLLSAHTPHVHRSIKPLVRLQSYGGRCVLPNISLDNLHHKNYAPDPYNPTGPLISIAMAILSLRRRSDVYSGLASLVGLWNRRGDVASAPFTAKRKLLTAVRDSGASTGSFEHARCPLDVRR